MNISWHRIRAVFLHSWYHLTQTRETQIDLFWFTFIQYIIFGFISKIISGGAPEMAKGLLLGFLVWEIVRTGQYCVTVSMMWEVWSKSFNSLFISPLTMTEWIIGQMTAALFKTSLVVSLLSVLGYFAFGFSLYPVGMMIFIYSAIALAFSFAAGLFIMALIIRFGTNIQSLAWGMIYLFQPISAVFYPLAAVPKFLQWVSYLSPITYVMEAARLQYNTGVINWQYLGIGSVVCAIYCLAAWLFLKQMYTRSRTTGEFARLGN